MKYISFVLIIILSSCSLIEDQGNEIVPQTIDRIEVEYLYDNVTYKLSNKDTFPDETIAGVEHNAEFTSIAGTSRSENGNHFTEFDRVVLGKLLSGYMEVYFDNSRKVDIRIRQTRAFDSFVNGKVSQLFSFRLNNIPFYSSYKDAYTDLTVDEYRLAGTGPCRAEVTYREDNDLYAEELIALGCGSRAYVKVKVHFKGSQN
ncbi:MAG: hypothetical protein KDC80_02010 [Saprospiraceae bacterium]|nr:hypothetical protein [Saprospiraceae bacterium]